LLVGKDDILHSEDEEHQSVWLSKMMFTSILFLLPEADSLGDLAIPRQLAASSVDFSSLVQRCTSSPTRLNANILPSARKKGTSVADALKECLAFLDSSRSLDFNLLVTNYIFHGL
jgi:hypothetical protein